MSTLPQIPPLSGLGFGGSPFVSFNARALAGGDILNAGLPNVPAQTRSFSDMYMAENIMDGVQSMNVDIWQPKIADLWVKAHPQFRKKEGGTPKGSLLMIFPEDPRLRTKVATSLVLDEESAVVPIGSVQEREQATMMQQMTGVYPTGVSVMRLYDGKPQKVPMMAAAHCHIKIPALAMGKRFSDALRSAVITPHSLVVMGTPIYACVYRHRVAGGVSMHVCLLSECVNPVQTDLVGRMFFLGHSMRPIEGDILAVHCAPMPVSMN